MESGAARSRTDAGTGLHPLPCQTRGNRDARFAAVLVLSGMSCRHQWHLRSSLLALFVRTLRHVHQVAAWRGPASAVGKVVGDRRRNYGRQTKSSCAILPDNRTRADVRMTTPVRRLEGDSGTPSVVWPVYSELARDACEAKRRRGLSSFDSRLANAPSGDAPIVAALDNVHADPQFHCSPIFAPIHSAPGTDGLSDAAIRARLERARRTRSLEHRDRSAVPSPSTEISKESRPPMRSPNMG
jgi:hypothetical protein